MSRAPFLSPLLVAFSLSLGACGQVERNATPTELAPDTSTVPAAPLEPVTAPEPCGFHGAYQALSAPAGTCSVAYAEDGSSTALSPSELCEGSELVFAAPLEPVYAALGTKIIFEPIACGGSE